MESFNSFLFTLNTLDLSGTKNALVTLQDLRRFVKWLNILEVTYLYGITGSET